MRLRTYTHVPRIEAPVLPEREVLLRFVFNSSPNGECPQELYTESLE
ncbi:hypothetical protein [Marispirochaeta sp.]|nr:hypothetical protein [Marispirochaeta sp.]